MHVEHGPRIGTPSQTTYYSEWRFGADGYQHRRIITLVVDIVDISDIDPAAAPLLPRKVPQWSIIVTDHSTGNLGQPTIVSDQVVSAVRPALKLLREAVEQAIRDGYATKSDLERVPVPGHGAPLD